jgi:hypothetical protein
LFLQAFDNVCGVVILVMVHYPGFSPFSGLAGEYNSRKLYQNSITVAL